MSRKQIISGIAVVVAGAALYVLLKVVHSSSSEESEPAPPPLVTVQTGQLKRTTLHGYVEGFGLVAPAPAGNGQPAASAHIASPVAGVIAETHVAEGQRVEKGALLFTLDTRTVQVAVERARKAVDFASQAAERQKTLFDSHNTSAKSLQDAEALLAAAKADLAAAETQLALLHIQAPLAGTVTHVYVRPGEAVDLNMAVADLVDLSRLVIASSIPVYEASELKTGQTVDLLTQPPLKASVSYVSPAVDATNATVMVRIALPETGQMRSGEFVRFRVLTAEHVDCLAAPAESVVSGTNGQSVIALVSDSEATQAPVKTGLREDGWVEVQAPGLQPGQTVVTVGAYGLPAKTKIRVANP